MFTKGKQIILRNLHGMVRKLMWPTLFKLTLTLFLLPIVNLSQDVQKQNLDALIVAIRSSDSEEKIRSIFTSHTKVVTSNFCTALHTEGEKHYTKVEYDQAFSLFTGAKICAVLLNDDDLISEAAYSLGKVYYGRGQLTQAIESYMQALKTSENDKSDSKRIYIFKDLSATYRNMAEYEKAKEFGQKGYDLAVQLKDIRGQAVNRFILATVDFQIGDYEVAQRSYEHCLQEFEKLGDNWYTTLTLSNLANLLRGRGDFRQAATYYDKALQKSEDNPRLEVAIYSGLDALYYEQGDIEKSIFYCSEALKLAQQLKDQWIIAVCLLNLGNKYFFLRKDDDAMACAQKGLAIAKQIDANRVIVGCELRIALLSQRKKNYSQALEHFTAAIKLARERDMRQWVGYGLWKMATLYFEMDRLPDALKLANESADIATKFKHDDYLFCAQTLLGKIYRKLKDYKAAYNSLTSAIDSIETIRSNVFGDSLERQNFFEIAIEAYHEMIALHIEQGDNVKALEYAEKAKGRALLEIFRSGRLEISKGLTVEEKDKEKTLYERLIDLNLSISKERSKNLVGNPKLNLLQAQFLSAKADYESYQQSLYDKHPELRLKRAQLPPFLFSNISNLLKDNKTAIVEYVVTESTCFAFLISKNIKDDKLNLISYEVKINKESLAEKVEQFHRFLSSNDPEFRYPAREFYNLLIKPMESELVGKNTLIIIPDGCLWELPFQALEHNNKYFMEERAISYSPSLQILQEIRHRSDKLKSTPLDSSANPGHLLLAMANPTLPKARAVVPPVILRGINLTPLPDAEKEVDALSQSIYPKSSCRIYKGTKATKEIAIKEMGEFRVLHFATHAILNDQQPLESSLLLAGDSDSLEAGLLKAGEIMNMKLNADIAVLSACETARGKIRVGEGVVGMSWAFFAAEVPTVISTQWKIPSPTTANLMISFHKNLRSGMSKSEALRQAQLKFIADENYRYKPFYWAAFIAIGSSE